MPERLRGRSQVEYTFPDKGWNPLRKRVSSNLTLFIFLYFWAISWWRNYIVFGQETRLKTTRRRTQTLEFVRMYHCIVVRGDLRVALSFSLLSFYTPVLRPPILLKLISVSLLWYSVNRSICQQANQIFRSMSSRKWYSEYLAFLSILFF